MAKSLFKVQLLRNEPVAVSATVILQKAVVKKLTDPNGPYKYNINQDKQDKLIKHLFKILDGLNNECIYLYIKEMTDQLVTEISVGSYANLVRTNFTLSTKCIQKIAHTVFTKYDEKWKLLTEQARLRQELCDYQEKVLDFDDLKQGVLEINNKNPIVSLIKLIKLACEIPDRAKKIEAINIFEEKSESIFSVIRDGNEASIVTLWAKKLYTLLSYPGKLEALIRAKEVSRAHEFEVEEKKEEVAESQLIHLENKLSLRGGASGELVTINFVEVIIRSGITSPQALQIIYCLETAKILSTINDLVKNGQWTKPWLGRWDWGVVGYLEESCLEKAISKHSTLLKDVTKDEQTTIINAALGIGFEIINMSAMESNLPNPICSMLFAQKHSYLIQEWLKTHPEYFVDPFVAKCILDQQSYLKIVHCESPEFNQHEFICDALEPYILNQYSVFNGQTFAEIIDSLLDMIETNIYEQGFKAFSELELEVIKQTSNEARITKILGVNLSQIQGIFNIVENVLVKIALATLSSRYFFNKESLLVAINHLNNYFPNHSELTYEDISSFEESDNQYELQALLPVSEDHSRY